MRTASGARVITADGRALKYGYGDVGIRIGAQAKYCQYLGSKVCPDIYMLGRRWYTMERLDHLASPTTATLYINCALEVLQNYVWERPALHWTTNWQQHFDYILTRVDEYCPKLMDRACYAIDAVNTEYTGALRCLTHGDPTYENMMYGRPSRARVVLVDPLPPTDYMPELRAVDLGKMIQSLLGYEGLRDEGRRLISACGFDGRLRELRDRAYCTPNEWQAALWFGFAHCVRLLPYQTADQRWKYERLASDALMHNTWSSCM